MSCSPFDLKDYFFGELPAAERSATESHLSSCALCREELSRLGETRALLLSIPDEEPPRRIAFVSDKVFEPRWWQRLWASGPQLGFASAAMLAVAIMVHGALMRPAPAVATTAVQAPEASPATLTEAKFTQADLDRIVEQKLAEREAHQMQRVTELVNAKTRELEKRRRDDLVLVGEYLERVNKSTQQVRKASWYGNE